MSDLNNILPPDPGGHRKGPLPEDKLMAYLEGKLSSAEQHEVEQWLADEGMESDAIEGLGRIKAEETRQSVYKLNHHLRKTINSKKKRRKTATTNQYTLIAIFITLMLAVLAFWTIKIMK